MIEITITAETGPGEDSRILTFKTNSSMGTEILPSIFKTPELATGTTAWIDFQRMSHRFQQKNIVRPLMAPIRLCNTSFQDRIAGTLGTLLVANGLHVVNSVGVHFTVKYAERKNSSRQESTLHEAKKDTEIDSGLMTSMKAVPIVRHSKPVSSIFATVSNYVPREVGDSL